MPPVSRPRGYCAPAELNGGAFVACGYRPPIRHSAQETEQYPTAGGYQMTIPRRNVITRKSGGAPRVTALAGVASAFLLVLSISPTATLANTLERTSGLANKDVQLYKCPKPGETATDHFVASVSDDLFTGVAISDGGAGHSRNLVVYLCDGKGVSHWRSGETPGKQATLSRNGATVDLTIAGDRVSKKMTLGGQQAQPFSAPRATGVAGIYRAEWTLAGAHYLINWIALSDGRQRGSLDGKGNDVSVMIP